jgi:mono/diheme cytochrome c family protein
MLRVLVSAMLLGTGHAALAHAADGSSPLDPGSVKSGRAIYGQQCASCHGVDAQGAPNWKEPDERGELPAPPQNAEGHTWRHSDTMLYEMITKGMRDPFNSTTRLTMPPFGDVLSPEQIQAVIAYLKTLWTPEQRAFQSEESRDGASMTKSQ